eukprot:Awhi_evm1s10027
MKRSYYKRIQRSKNKREKHAIECISLNAKGLNDINDVFPESIDSHGKELSNGEAVLNLETPSSVHVPRDHDEIRDTESSFENSDNSDCDSDFIPSRAKKSISDTSDLDSDGDFDCNADFKQSSSSDSNSVTDHSDSDDDMYNSNFEILLDDQSNISDSVNNNDVEL